MPDFAYQDAGVEFLRAQSRALLGDDPGLGKSRQLLLAAEGPTLVLAPAAILDAGVWTFEHQRWRPDLELVQCSYSALCRRVRTPKGGYEVLPQPKPEYAKTVWGTVIADEAHYLKGRKTSWALAAHKLKTHRFWMATGTPIPNYAYELWGLLRFLYPRTDRRFSSFWRWARHYPQHELSSEAYERHELECPGCGWFQVWEPPYGGTKFLGLTECDPDCADRPPHDPCTHWHAFQRENLGGRYLARRRGDVGLGLPPVTPQTIETPMAPAQRKAYRELKAEFLTMVEAADDRTVPVMAWSKGGLHTKLAKATTGLETLVPGSKGSGKLDVLRELLEDRRADATLVLVWFRDTGRAVMDLLGRMDLYGELYDGGTPKLERERIVRDFQAGKVPVMVGSLGTIAEGLTLTRADTAIFVERAWRPSRNSQAVDRLNRIGQTRPVTAITLVTPKTVDAAMSATLESKSDEQARALSVGDFAAML